MASGLEVSVVTIGLNNAEIGKVRQRVSNQTYDNVEVVGSTKEGIPTAWNDAIKRASGDLYVFTETDAAPISKDWLKRIVADFDLPEQRVAHYGEIGRPGHGYDLSNLAVPGAVMDQFSFDESYPIVEDTELFTRMDKAGVTFEKWYENPVYHHPATERQNKRAFQRGYYQMRCRLTHGQLGVSDERRHVPSNLTEDMSVSESSSMMNIALSQATKPLESAMVDLKFLAGGGAAALRYWL